MKRMKMKYDDDDEEQNVDAFDDDDDDDEEEEQNTAAFDDDEEEENTAAFDDDDDDEENADAFDDDEENAAADDEEEDASDASRIRCPIIKASELRESFDWTPASGLKKKLHIKGTVLDYIDSDAQGAVDLCNTDVAPRLTELDAGAFRDTEGLTGVRIPKSVKKIGTHAFVENPKLRHIAYEGSMAEWKGVEKDKDWFDLDLVKFSV